MISSTEIFTDTAVLGMIKHMPELDEMITVADALDLSEKAGRSYTRQHIAYILRKGDLPGARKIGRGRTGFWLIPRSAFLNWLDDERKPGPKPED